MRFRDLIESEDDLRSMAKRGDRDSMRAKAIRMDRDDFISKMVPWMSEPHTSYHGYDESDNLIAAFFDPARGSKYARVERIEPSRQKRVAYAQYLKRCEAAGKLWDDLVNEHHEISREQWQKDQSFTPEEIEIERNPRETGVYLAFIRGKRVGWLALNIGADKNAKPDTRSVFKVVVAPEYRRRGIARKLYQQAEADLAKQGLRLTPSGARTDDGKAFWSKYRPGAVVGESFYPGNRMYWVSPEGEVHTGFDDHGWWAVEHILGEDMDEWMYMDRASHDPDDEDHFRAYSEFLDDKEIMGDSPRDHAIVTAMEQNWVRAEVEVAGTLDLEAKDLRFAWQAAKLLVTDDIQRIVMSGIDGGNVPMIDLVEPALSRFLKTGRLPKKNLA